MYVCKLLSMRKLPTDLLNYIHSSRPSKRLRESCRVDGLKLSYMRLLLQLR